MSDGVNGEKVIEAVKEIMAVIAKRDLPILVDARLAEMDKKIAQIAERVAVRAANV